MIPHITEMMTKMITNEDPKMDDNVQRSLLLCFSSSAHLLCPLMFGNQAIEKGVSELEGVLIFKDQEINFIKWLISDLHENSVKRSHEALEILTTIAASFPWILIDNWTLFREYINIEFSISEVKKTVSILKLLETWISSISNERHLLLRKDDKELGEEEKQEERKLDTKTLTEVEYYNILNLEGCNKLLNKYLNFYVKIG